MSSCRLRRLKCISVESLLCRANVSLLMSSRCDATCARLICDEGLFSEPANFVFCFPPQSLAEAEIIPRRQSRFSHLSKHILSMSSNDLTKPSTEGAPSVTSSTAALVPVPPTTAPPLSRQRSAQLHASLPALDTPAEKMSAVSTPSLAQADAPLAPKTQSTSALHQGRTPHMRFLLFARACIV